MISYEDECWLKLSLVKSLDVPTLLAAIRKTGSVEEFLDSRLSALSTLVGLEAAREIQEVKASDEVEQWKAWLLDNQEVGFLTLTHPLYPDRHSTIPPSRFCGCRSHREPYGGCNVWRVAPYTDIFARQFASVSD